MTWSVEQRVVAALWSLPGVGRKTLSLLAGLGPLEQWFDVPGPNIAAAARFTAQAQQALAEVSSLARVAERLERALRTCGYELAFAGEPKYPERLVEIEDAPPVLFVSGPGAAAAPRRRVAMVGTRRPDVGFVEKARFFAQEVAQAGVGIVSGGAEGIDQACHGAALRVGQETWAFLGCAIEQIDPAQRVLVKPFRDANGTLYSEFPPGARPDRSTFPRRNRLISGAADAVVVLRAGLRSGALHTARYASAQGRPVMAMPGDFFNETAAGCNDLVRSGHAQVCLEPADVLKAVGLGAVRVPLPSTDTSSGDERVSELALSVLRQLERSPLDFDVLLAKVACASGELTSALLELELANRVVQRPGRRYEKV